MDRQEVDRGRGFITNHFTGVYTYNTTSVLVQHQGLSNVTPCTMSLFVLDKLGVVSWWNLVGSVKCHPPPSSVRCKSCRSTTSVSSSYQELELSIEGRETLEDCLVAFFKVASTLPLHAISLQGPPQEFCSDIAKHIHCFRQWTN